LENTYLGLDKATLGRASFHIKKIEIDILGCEVTLGIITQLNP